MTRLINDLMDVSRITSDKLVLQVSRIELADVILIAVETSRPLIVERQHQLIVKMPEAPVMLDADPARLAQVLSNLLSNAAQYTAPGGEIRVTAEVRGRDVVIAVRDNGLGIEPEMALRVFDLFTQGTRSSVGHAGGLGIGLTLAKRLVEMLGGELELRSEGAGRGSEFSITLPLAFASFERSHSRSEPEPLLTVSKRILVVDDNQDSAEMLAVLLQTWGQDTRVAFGGAAALETGREFQPEIVLLDLGMPHPDGYETARRLRAEPWGKDLVLVAVTGWGHVSDMERTQQAGFEHHLVKPIVPHQLRLLIET
jgi:CheY-like chemotaxis protein